MNKVFQFYYLDKDLNKWLEWDRKYMSQVGADERLETLIEVYNVAFKYEIL